MHTAPITLQQINVRALTACASQHRWVEPATPPRLYHEPALRFCIEYLCFCQLENRKQHSRGDTIFLFGAAGHIRFSTLAVTSKQRPQGPMSRRRAVRLSHASVPPSLVSSRSTSLRLRLPFPFQYSSGPLSSSMPPPARAPSIRHMSTSRVTSRAHGVSPNLRRVRRTCTRA